jgi:hypothetical protein
MKNQWIFYNAYIAGSYRLFSTTEKWNSSICTICIKITEKDARGR